MSGTRAIFVPLLAGVVGVGATVMFLERVHSPGPVLPPAPAFVPSAPPASAFGWRLTSSMSAHRGLVLEVETTRPGETVAIAQQLTELYKERFDEVLVFFVEPDANPRRAFERVQWTRRNGYRTLALRERR